MSTSIRNEIMKICTEFVQISESATKCDNRDYLVHEIPVAFSKKEIMQALNVTTAMYAVPVFVNHEKLGKIGVLVLIRDQSIVLSTLKKLR